MRACAEGLPERCAARRRILQVVPQNEGSGRTVPQRVQARRQAEPWTQAEPRVTTGKLVTCEPAWLASPPSEADVIDHLPFGGRWLCSPPRNVPVFFDLVIGKGGVVVRHAGSALADVLKDGNNVTRFDGAKWARVTFAGVPIMEVAP